MRSPFDELNPVILRIGDNEPVAMTRDVRRQVETSCLPAGGSPRSEEASITIDNHNSIVFVIRDSDAPRTQARHVARVAELVGSSTPRADPLPQTSRGIETADSVVARVGNPNVTVAIECQSRWPLQRSRAVVYTAKAEPILTGSIEHANAVVSPVLTDEYRSVGTDRNVGWQHELPRANASFAKSQQLLPR